MSGSVGLVVGEEALRYPCLMSTHPHSILMFCHIFTIDIVSVIPTLKARNYQLSNLVCYHLSIHHPCPVNGSLDLEFPLPMCSLMIRCSPWTAHTTLVHQCLVSGWQTPHQATWGGGAVRCGTGIPTHVSLVPRVPPPLIGDFLDAS